MLGFGWPAGAWWYVVIPVRARPRCWHLEDYLTFLPRRASLAPPRAKHAWVAAGGRPVPGR